jgi:glutaconyl-CoA/methylmalonyl-CoA decarboxylase subunit gamma
MKYKISVADRCFEIEIGRIQNGMAQVTVDQVPYEVKVETIGAAPAPVPDAAPTAAAAPAAAPRAADRPAPAAVVSPGAGMDRVVAPIPGLIIDIKVRVGEAVAAGQVVAIIEAMKMENNLTSRIFGTVVEIVAQKGAQVSTDDVIMVIGTG